MRTHITTLLLLLSAFITGGSASRLAADAIIKKDKERIEGDIVEQGTSYLVTTPDGKTRLVTKNSVKEIIWGESVNTLLKNASSSSDDHNDRIAIDAVGIPKDAQTGPFTLRHLLRLPEKYKLAGFHCLSVGVGGKLVAVATRNKCVLVIDVNDPPSAAAIVEGEDTHCVAFYPEKPALLACGTDNAVHLLVAPHWTYYHSLKECGDARWLSFRPSTSGRLMAVDRNSIEFIWNPVIMRDTTLNAPPPLVKLGASFVSPGVGILSPRGTWIAKPHIGMTSGHAIALFKPIPPNSPIYTKNLDAPNIPKLIAELNLPVYKRRNVIEHPAKILEGSPTETGVEAEPTFSPDESLCLSGGFLKRHVITAWNVSTGRVAQEISVPERRDSIEAISGLSFSGDGRWFTAGWGRFIGVWEVSLEE